MFDAFVASLSLGISFLYNSRQVLQVRNVATKKRKDFSCTLRVAYMNEAENNC